MVKKTKNIIEDELDPKDGVFKKTVYIDGDVMLALREEADRRGIKKTTTLINQILREAILSESSVEARLKALEDKVELLSKKA
jgi:hypothetical protein